MAGTAGVAGVAGVAVVAGAAGCAPPPPPPPVLEGVAGVAGVAGTAGCAGVAGAGATAVSVRNITPANVEQFPAASQALIAAMYRVSGVSPENVYDNSAPGDAWIGMITATVAPAQSASTNTEPTLYRISYWVTPTLSKDASQVIEAVVVVGGNKVLTVGDAGAVGAVVSTTGGGGAGATGEGVGVGEGMGAGAGVAGGGGA